MSNVGGRPFGMVMHTDSLMDFFFFDGGCLGKVTGSKREVVMVEMILGMIEGMILANFGMLLEMAILVQLMARDGRGKWWWRRALCG